MRMRFRLGSNKMRKKPPAFIAAIKSHGNSVKWFSSDHFAIVFVVRQPATLHTFLILRCCLFFIICLSFVSCFYWSRCGAAESICRAHRVRTVQSMPNRNAIKSHWKIVIGTFYFRGKRETPHSNALRTDHTVISMPHPKQRSDSSGAQHSILHESSASTIIFDFKFMFIFSRSSVFCPLHQMERYRVFVAHATHLK